MRDLLEKLGNPKQAQVVPTQIERIARAQFGLVHSILKRRLMWERDSLALTYLKSPNRLGSNGLPIYCVFAEGVGVPVLPSTLSDDEMVATFVKPILNRFKGRAQIGITTTEDHAFIYQWGMWLEEDMITRYEEQQLPIFENEVFDFFAEFGMETRLPMFASNYELLSNRLEACGAITMLTPLSETSSLIIMPALRVRNNEPVPEPERFEYVLRQFAPWSVGITGFVQEVPNQILESVAVVENIEPSRLVKASIQFTQLRTMGNKPLTEASFPLTHDELFAYLGVPHRKIEAFRKGVDVYDYECADALFHLEWSEGIMQAYHFPSAVKSSLLFEQFCRELTG